MDVRDAESAKNEVYRKYCFRTMNIWHSINGRLPGLSHWDLYRLHGFFMMWFWKLFWTLRIYKICRQKA